MLLAVGTAAANHSWGNYHWARSSNPLQLSIGSNVSSTYSTNLGTAVSDWDRSTVLSLTQVGGAGLRNCDPVAGRVEVCNDSYGNRGWLGIARIWASGDHITQGTVELNDSYLVSGNYNSDAWRQLVTCQEVGHTFGLDHQDENNNNTNLGTCMDYTSKPLGPPLKNEHPNTHDYEELDIIYGHLDSTSTIAPSVVASSPAADDWGRSIRLTRDGKGRVYVKDLGPGRQLVTFVHRTPAE
jgi:hypothetical protein